MLQLLLLLAVVTSSTEGLNCRSCSQGAWTTLSTENNDCYNNAIMTPTTVCVAPQTYCLATFTIRDGQVSGVERGCADPATDYDTTTTTIPTGPDCTTSYSTISSSADTTTCFYPCSASDNCNSLSTLGLRTCTAGSNNCNSATNQGYCNFFTGSCVCNAGFSGNECQTAAAVAVTTRSCVQCNSVTDATCETMTTSTPCPANVASYKFCEASWSHTIDSTGAVIRSVITRGCSNVQQTPDRCRFSGLMDSRFVGHHEYTCTSTCESNGCNTFSPDGLITGSETKAVYCVVCEDKSGNGLCNSATART
uniref:EGF-like domain-containing protein n=1 Tax=Ciona savignyi TaxID=51511 RepID=H2YKK1_CIOSA